MCSSKTGGWILSFVFLFFVSVCGFLYGQVIPQLTINEFLASNISSNIDPDFTQYADWIEIYNGGSSHIDIGGYYLTDDFDEPFKWRIPANAVIISKGTLLIWADGRDVSHAAFHTNFKLKKSGEEIALVSPTGIFVDSLTYEDQMTDISYGRYLNSSSWVYYFSPTPGRINDTQAIFGAQAAAEPTFSLSSGFYHGHETVELKVESHAAAIYYTTDGSLPTQNSELYTAPIELETTTPVRARSYEPGKLPSSVVSRSIFIDEGSSLPVISVITEPKNLWDPGIGIYVDEEIGTRKEWERPVQITYFDPAGSPVFTVDANMRLFGRTAIYIPQKSLSIFAEETIRYPLFPDKKIETYDTFLLRSSSDDWHRTLFADGFMHVALNNHFHLTYQAYRPAVVYLNGVYWGIHNLREKYNESFVEDYYGVDFDSIDLIFIDKRTDTIEILAGDDLSYRQTEDFVSNADMTVTDNYQYAESIIDIDNFIDYIIAESYYANTSWAHNIRMWRPKTATGRWCWLIFDLDRGFRDPAANTLQDITDRYPLFRNLARNEDFRQKFVKRYIDEINVAFRPERLYAIIDSLESNIEEELPRHIERWKDHCGNGVCGIPSMTRWRDYVEVLRTFAAERPSAVLRQLSNQFSLEGSATLSVRVVPEGTGEVTVNGTVATESTYDGVFEKNSTVHLEAREKDGYLFVRWQVPSSSAVEIMSRGSIWKYLDDGTDLGMDWIDATFDDSQWPSGPAELGYGDGDEATVIGFGPDNQNKNMTAYFRSSFYVRSPSSLQNLMLYILRDDGAVVYINGFEAARSNMPAGAVDYSTPSSSTVGGDDERVWYEYPIDLDLLVEGENTIAVEIHQTNSTSSDVSFDLELLGAQSPTDSESTLLGQGSMWKYLDDGSDLGEDWRQIDFDDISWSSGPAELGYGDGDESTTVGYGSDPGDKYITTYFRTSFFVEDPARFGEVSIRLVRDDGAVLYLNGDEVVRSNMPDGPIDYLTPAEQTVGDASEQSFYEFSINPDKLVKGDNVVAAEIHQINGSSSDIGFDLEIVGRTGSGTAPVVVSTDPVYSFTMTGDTSLDALFQLDTSHILPSDITGDTVLTVANSPYYASGDLTVSGGSTLTIEPGVELLMPGAANIFVYGKLLAEGSEGERIRVRSLDDTLRWGAFCFIDASDSSRLSFVEIDGATQGSDPAAHRGAITGINSNLFLDHVVFTNVNQSLFVDRGKIIVKNCTIDGTQAGDDMVNIKYAFAVIENCDLYGNGELDFDFVDNGIIRNNRITTISTDPNRDGIDIGTSENVEISGNRIFDCPDKGISVGEKSTVTIDRNTIVDCGLGIAVKDSSRALIVNNTLYKNDVGIACFEKIASQGGGTARILNTIFSKSDSVDYELDQLSSASFSYSLSDTRTLPGTGNVLADPRFVNPGQYDFHLNRRSPCIDAGDPESADDPDGSIADIGAFYYDRTYGGITSIRINELMASNSTAAADENREFDDWIEIYNGTDKPVDLAGLYITDNFEAPTLWQIPTGSPDSTTVQPDGFLVLWADHDIRQGVRHLDFRLNNAGEQVALVFIDDADTVFIDSTRFGELGSDESWGRLPDGGVEWVLFEHSTPGYANTESGKRRFRLNSPADGAMIHLPANGDSSITFSWTPFIPSTPLDTLKGYDFRLYRAAGELVMGLTVYKSDITFSFSSTNGGEYFWFVLARDNYGGITSSDTFRIALMSPVAVKAGMRLPQKFALHRNYPNPFNPTTEIQYDLPRPAVVKLVIYDIIGRQVRTLVDQRLPAGYQRVIWDGRDEVGRPVASGIYFYHLTADRFDAIRKMMLLK